MSLINKEINNSCLVLTINRADKRNALNEEMYRELAAEIRAHSNDEQVKVLLLRGEGEHFTAGNDLSQFAKLASKEQLQDTFDFMRALAEFPMPVVAQVRGMAVGIGTTLLLHCDFVYCDTSAKFSMPFINLGLVPEYASSLLLPALVGHRKAAEWLLLGDSFGAEEALQYGLVNQVTSPEELQEKCSTTISQLAQKPRQAMIQSKALMKSNSAAVDKHIDTEIEFFIERLNSEAAKEAFSAFLQKRKPDPSKYK